MSGKSAILIFLSIFLTGSARTETPLITLEKSEDNSNVEFFIVDHNSDSSRDPDPTGVLDNPYAYGVPRMVQFGLGIEW